METHLPFVRCFIWFFYFLEAGFYFWFCIWVSLDIFFSVFLSFGDIAWQKCHCACTLRPWNSTGRIVTALHVTRLTESLPEVYSILCTTGNSYNSSIKRHCIGLCVIFSAFCKTENSEHDKVSVAGRLLSRVIRATGKRSSHNISRDLDLMVPIQRWRMNQDGSDVTRVQIITSKIIYLSVFGLARPYIWWEYSHGGSFTRETNLCCEHSESKQKPLTVCIKMTIYASTICPAKCRLLLICDYIHISGFSVYWPYPQKIDKTASFLNDYS